MWDLIKSMLHYPDYPDVWDWCSFHTCLCTFLLMHSCKPMFNTMVLLTMGHLNFAEIWS